MKILLTIFVLLFSSSVVAYEKIISCKSKQNNLIQYNRLENVLEDITTFYKIKIDTNIRQIYIYEVIENDKVAEQSKLYTNQVWTITSGDNEDIRAYGSLLGEIMYSKNSGLLTFTFPLGGAVGITIADCN